MRETIAAGADLVTFSGDKLLGGPQAGIIVGRADLIARLKKNPLKRALRVGQADARGARGGAALYRDPERLAERLPSLAPAHARRTSRCGRRRERLLPVVQRAVGDAYEVARRRCASQIGSGALPVDRLPSHGARATRRADGTRAQLGRVSKPRCARCRGRCIGRIADKTLWLDLRCLEDADEAAFVAQLAQLDLSASR